MRRIFIFLSVAMFLGFIQVDAYSTLPRVSCGQFGTAGNSCDQCFRGVPMYVGETQKVFDVFNAGGSDWIHFRHENTNNYQISVLNSNTRWYTSNSLLEYRNFNWQTARNGRKYAHFRKGTRTAYLATRPGKGIKLQSVITDNVDPYKPAYRFKFIDRSRRLISRGNVSGINTHTECVFFMPRYCGDGILQTNKGEVCDPRDSLRRGWGNGGCNTNTCRPVTTPECKSLTVNTTTGEAPRDVTATCTGYKVNTWKIDCGNGQVFTGSGNNSGDQAFSRTCKYTRAGNYAPRCYINNTITSNSCTKSVSITAPRVPSIVIDKRDANVSDIDGNVGNDTQTVYKGENARFKIRVTNNGQEALRNITLTDAVETSCATRAGSYVNLASRTFTNAKNAQVSIVVGGLGNHTNATLEAGEWFEYYCSKANTQANYTNTAATNAVGVTSGRSVNDSDPTLVRVIDRPVPNIHVDKRDANNNDLDTNIGGNDSQTVRVGDDAVFRITVRNNGTEDLRDVVLKDAVAPACASQGSINLQTKKFTNTDGATVSLAVSGNGNHNNNIFEVGEIFTYVCVKGNTRSNYTNVVDVEGTGVTTGTKVTDTDPTEVVIRDNPSIQVIKTDANPDDLDGAQFNDTQTVAKGEKAVFHITVRNNGTEDLKDLILEDAISASCASDGSVNLAGKYFTNKQGARVTIAPDAAGDHDNNIFEVGEEFTYTCEKANTQSNYTNVVDVKATGVRTGRQVTDDDPTNVIVVTPVYDLALIKKIKGSKTVFKNGDSVTFAITVKNQGNVRATANQLVDYIPAGLKLTDSDWSENNGKAYYNTAITLAPGASQVVDITFEITETGQKTIKNYAEISKDDGNDCDSTPDDLNKNTPGEQDGTLVDDDMRDGCNNAGDEDDHDVAEIKVVIPVPSIKIDKTDANSADKDGSTGNDTQTVDKAIKAVFKIRVTNDGTENLDTIVLTDAIAPNCAGTVTLPNTKPSTWLSWNVGGGNTSDAVLEPGEYFEYTCEKANTQSNYTNTATVKAKGVKTKKNVEDTDTTVVKVPGGGGGGGGGGGIYKCTGVSQSGSTVTCEGNSKTQSFYLKCGSTVKGPKNYTTKNGKHVANFTCTESAFQCYVYNQKNAPIEGRAWKTSNACRASSSSSCGNGIVESGEECDLGQPKTQQKWGRCNINTCKLSKGGGSNPKPNCKNDNSCVLTWPDDSETKFGPQGSIIIGHKQPALLRYPYIHNDSKNDIGFRYMCVKEVIGDGSIISTPSTEKCVNIDGETLFGYEKYYMVEEKIGSSWSAPKVVTQYVLNDLIAAGKARPPQFTGNKNGITGDYGQGKIVTTVANELPGVISGLNPYKYYFAADYSVKVAKPSISTVGGGTSLVKSTDSGDVAKVTNNKNTNFVGTSASSDNKAALSSDAETVKNTNTQVVEEIKKDAETIDTPKEVIKTDAVSTAKLEKYNGLDNVFIYKGADFNVSSIKDDLTKLTKPRTYIVENGNLIVDKNIAANKNIAFVVRGGNIHIEDQVVRMDGTYISIKKNNTGGNFTAEESGKQLLVKGSLYGDVSNLVDNRYYISDDTEGLSVGTIVSFGSGLFTKPAPLVTQFTKEYIKSTKVAR